MSSQHTEKYRAQHDELVSIVTGLSSNLTPAFVTANAGSVKESLNKLAGKISIHLALEDNALYPRLLSHANQGLREQAEKFQEEMGGIRDAFDSYLKTWSLSTVIEKDADKFISETNDLISVLADRITRENEGLYTLVDQEGL